MLTARARTVLDTLLPGGAHPTLPWGVFDAGFDGYYARFQAVAPWRLRAGFRLALAVAIWLAPLLIGRLPPISRLDRPGRERALLALYGSRSPFLRQMFFVLKATICFCYGADERVRGAIGIPEPGAVSPPQQVVS